MLGVDTLGGMITRGAVIDGSGFSVLDVVTVTDLTVGHTAIGRIVRKVGNQITIADLPFIPKVNDCIVARHPLSDHLTDERLEVGQAEPHATFESIVADPPEVDSLVHC